MTIPVKLGMAVLGGGSIAAGGYGIYELSKPKTIGQQLKWEGKTLGDVSDESNNKDNEASGLWQNLYTKYSSDTANSFKKIEGESSNPTISDKSDLKNHCKKIFEFPKNDQDNLDKARFWCIKESEKLGNR